LLFLTKKYSSDLSLRDKKNLKIIVLPNFFEKIFYRIIWINFGIPFFLIFYNVKVLYSPMNIAPLTIFFLKTKLILGMHTTLPWEFPELIPGNLIRNLLMKKIMEISIKNSHKTIFCSKSSLLILQKKLRINKKKLTYIYLGPGNDLKIKNLKNFNYKDKYILSVISCTRYHMILQMIKSFEKVYAKNKNIKFILVMSILDNKFYNEIYKYVLKKRLYNNVIFINNLESKYLGEIYRNSTLYIHSSLTESFGFTTLEAMKSGTMVLASDRKASREVNSNAAIFFNPYDIIDLKRKILKYLLIRRRKKYIKMGKRRVKNFSWKKNFDLTFFEIKKLVNTN